MKGLLNAFSAITREISGVQTDFQGKSRFKDSGALKDSSVCKLFCLPVLGEDTFALIYKELLTPLYYIRLGTILL